MNENTASTLALSAISFIVANDVLRDRFLAMTGLDGNELKERLAEEDFLASVLEFLISHEPDLIDFAESIEEKPELIVRAWRQLGGGAGQEW